MRDLSWIFSNAQPTAINVLSSTIGFPPGDQALDDPSGLLAIGGELTADWLMEAYRCGVFPWFEDDLGPILWWCPDPRAVLHPNNLKVSRSLSKRIRNSGFQVTMDSAFERVIQGCAGQRATGGGTWITPQMANGYAELHTNGYAHSVEVWDGGRLVGGLYGVSLGRMFFGESMFSLERDASKIALYHLARQLEEWEFKLIDCQIMNDHLASLGAESIPRASFLEKLAANQLEPTRNGTWRLGHPHAG